MSMEIGFIIPNYLGEKRVAILPEDIINFKDKLYIEKDFGKNLCIKDEEYQKKGCTILSREEIFKKCKVIFSLKLIQENDYKFLQNNSIIIGWTHPTGSGRNFMKIAKEKNITIIDLDNIYPAIYKDNNVFYLEKKLKKNFIRKNSELAGIASCYHALLTYGLLPNSNTNVAILSIGNVAQGAFQVFSKFGCNIRVFTRTTLVEFKEQIEKFDIIVNGIEIGKDDERIITLEEQKKIKKGCLIIDSAADGDGAIEGTKYTTISNPIYEKEGKFYYVVNNAPSIFYREASREISKSLSENIFKKGIDYLLEEM